MPHSLKIKGMISVPIPNPLLQILAVALITEAPYTLTIISPSFGEGYFYFY